MKIHMIEREPDALQQPVAIDRIQAMCIRAFGANAALEAIHELGGGSINTTYLLTPVGHPKLILRVAPSPHHPQAFLNEDVQLRQEYHMQPFFAPIAALMPQTLSADFTRQLLDRDYMFQTYLEGDPWSTLYDDLTVTEQQQLYRQLGSLTQQIHAVTGKPLVNCVNPFLGGALWSLTSWSKLFIN